MDVSQEQLEHLAAQLGQALNRRGWRLVCAESCTGGWAAQAMTAVAGSSTWFERGFVTYSNDAKQDLLGVGGRTLVEFGAVSTETAREMAEGALQHSRAQCAFAVTGIAGPGGGSPDKPVGTVCFAWVWPGEAPLLDRQHFTGDRRQVRAQAVRHALGRMLALVT
ncbi:MAG: nicotinamide-nucleotide amidohydrolase family protein [Pseudomonadota bacterium]